MHISKRKIAKHALVELHRDADARVSVDMNRGVWAWKEGTWTRNGVLAPKAGDPGSSARLAKKTSTEQDDQ
jgi:hypothetical protein